MQSGVYEQLSVALLREYDGAQGIDWEWIAIDGALTKPPLGGKTPGPILRIAPE